MVPVNICCCFASIRQANENIDDKLKFANAILMLFELIKQIFTQKQKKHLGVQTIRVVMANDLFTHDSFLDCGRIKEAISNLPIATKDVDIEETAVLEDDSQMMESDCQTEKHSSSNPMLESRIKEKSDPFGFDAWIPNASKRDLK